MKLSLQKYTDHKSKKLRQPHKAKKRNAVAKQSRKRNRA